MDAHQGSYKSYSFFSVIIKSLLIVIVGLGLGACSSGGDGLQGGGTNPEVADEVSSISPGAARWYARHNRAQPQRDGHGPEHNQIARNQ